jgi:hypothetical protein
VKLIVTDQIIELDSTDLIYFIQGLSICTKPDGYKTVVFTAGIHKHKYLCRVLMDCPAHLEVDHIDGNTLNNSRSNLRIVTSQQNKANTILRKGSIGHKGVIRHGRGYKATITHNYKQIYLGIFDTHEEAVTAYKLKADELRGEFALHNSRKDTSK